MQRCDYPNHPNPLRNGRIFLLAKNNHQPHILSNFVGNLVILFMPHTLFDSVDTAERSLLEQALTQAVATHGLDMAMVSHFFDARHLPCPMPLLKAKLTLRLVADGHALYLIATDKNSQHDLVAFCQKNGHTVHAWQSEQDDAMLYHFLIFKSSSN